MAAGAVAEPRAGDGVGKKRKPDDSAPKKVLKQFALRLPLDVAGRVEGTAETLGLDSANLLRLIVVTNLSAYEKKAERVRSGLPAE